MSITRLIVRGVAITAGCVRVPARAAHHARVTRVRCGDAVELLDLDGWVGIGVLSAWEGDECLVEIDTVVTDRGEPPAACVLGLGVLHTSAMEWAVEKATELGASVVVPVLSERVQGRDHHTRVARWQRVADAAVSQCGRSRAPRIENPATLGSFVERAVGARVVAEQTGERFGALDAAAGVTVLIGPEGGLLGDELALAKEAGFVALPLGSRVLRAETAAVAALALVQHLAGWQ